MYRDKRIAVVVPCYNEEHLIINTLKGIPEFVDKIIVVDDASKDFTHFKMVELSNRNENIVFIGHFINKGVGAAISTGYRASKKLNMDITAVMAGDGQMPPGDLTKILDPVIDGKADYTKGNRFIIPIWKYFGNVILSFFTRLLTGYKISDCQSGYTAITREMLDKLDLDKIYPRYGMPNDMLFKLSKLKARVQDVYTRPVYHIGEKTGIRLRSVVPKISWLFLRELCQKLK